MPLSRILAAHATGRAPRIKRARITLPLSVEVKEKDKGATLRAMLVDAKGTAHGCIVAYQVQALEMSASCRASMRALQRKLRRVLGCFVVQHAEIDKRLRGRGYGRSMYEAIGNAAAKRHAAILSHLCDRGQPGSVSDEARRAWESLCARHVHTGNPWSDTRPVAVLAVEP